MKTSQTCIDGAYRANAERLKALRQSAQPDTARHSPLPWIAQAIYPGNYSLVPAKYAKQASSWTIGNIHGQKDSEGDARLIVRAVNGSPVAVKMEGLLRRLLPIVADDWALSSAIANTLGEWERSQQ